MNSLLNIASLLQEASLKATTSGGKGGQNVNKVATRIELYFDILNSAVLSDEQKEVLLHKIRNRINADGVLRIVSSEKRSQLENKEEAKKKFAEIISKALTPQKARKQSKPSAQSKEERIRKKKLLSEKKKSRTEKFDL